MGGHDVILQTFLYVGNVSLEGREGQRKKAGRGRTAGGGPCPSSWKLRGRPHAGGRGAEGRAAWFLFRLGSWQQMRTGRHAFHVCIEHTHTHGPLLLSLGPRGPLFPQEHAAHHGQMLPESREGWDPCLSDSLPHQLPDIGGSLVTSARPGLSPMQPLLLLLPWPRPLCPHETDCAPALPQTWAHHRLLDIALAGW